VISLLRHRPASRVAIRRGCCIAVVLAGSLGAVACGQGSPAGAPVVSAVPLASGARVVARVRRCDPGVHAYCAQELVIAAPPARYPSSEALQTAETQRLTSAGWASAEGDTTHERSAESPGSRLRLTYATGQEDLQAVDLGTVDRAPAIARALARNMFRRTPALSLILESGSS
jgi:hypothetical protein